MVTILITSLLLDALGVGTAIWRLRGLPESISAMVYLPKGGWRWLWTVWLLLVDVLTFAPAVEILDARGLGAVGFLPMVLIAFVAVWPLFDTEHRTLHYVFAVAAGVASQVAVVIICPWWLAAWAVMVVLPFLSGKRARTSTAGTTKKWGVVVAEMICAAAVYGALLTRLAATS